MAYDQIRNMPELYNLILDTKFLNKISSISELSYQY